MSLHHQSDATGRRPLRVWVLLGVATAALAGCGGGSRQALIAEPTYVSMAEAQPFTFALQQRYLELSSRAYDRGDRQGADFYGLRSILAIEGKAVELLTPREAGLRGPLAEEAALVRRRLIGVFDEGVRIHAAEDAARAQALYDCWLREAGAGTDPGQMLICQGAALTALTRLEAAIRGAPRLADELPPQFVVGPMGPSMPPPMAGYPAAGPLSAPQGIAYAAPGPAVTVRTQVHFPPASGVQAPPALATGYAPAAQPPLPYARYQVTSPVESQRGSPSAPYDAPTYAASVDLPTPAPAPTGILSMPPQGLSGPLPAPRFAGSQGGGVSVSMAAPGPVLAPPSWTGAPAAGFAQAGLQGPQYAALPAATPGVVLHDGGSGRAPAPAPRGEDLAILFPAPMGGTISASPQALSAPGAGSSLPAVGLADAPPRPILPEPPSAPAEPPRAQVVSPQASGSDAGQAMAAAAQERPRGLPVFFEFGSNDLTPEAEDILDDIAAEARRRKARRISLAGFTDSAGSPRYNQLLAMRRAQAVRLGLEKRLGSSVVFEVLPAGEAGQATSTADEVREAANRRVEIAILP
ncbi:OmpA family protein [Neomegalonema sp.]|uniref:OmpA family protein n=1 Tax=Neomegalonema sp. TaxID=2039713 RepID=UPI0026210CF5|nr:OmpA family protein [Neomegalonema sp.]MDD2870305.1 OmpA family protein [Neomegalonema sp.]